MKGEDPPYWHYCLCAKQSSLLPVSVNILTRSPKTSRTRRKIRRVFHFHTRNFECLLPTDCSNLPVKSATWIWAVWAKLCGRCELSIVLFTASVRCWSLGLMFGDWLMPWLKLTILFSKAYSIHLHYAIRKHCQAKVSVWMSRRDWN